MEFIRWTITEREEVNRRLKTDKQEKNQCLAWPKLLLLAITWHVILNRQDLLLLQLTPSPLPEREWEEEGRLPHDCTWTFKQHHSDARQKGYPHTSLWRIARTRTLLRIKMSEDAAGSNVVASPINKLTPFTCAKYTERLQVHANQHHTKRKGWQTHVVPHQSAGR